MKKLKLLNNDKLKNREKYLVKPSMNIKNFESYRPSEVLSITRSNTESNGSDKKIKEILEDIRTRQQINESFKNYIFSEEMNSADGPKNSSWKSTKCVRFIELNELIN